MCPGFELGVFGLLPQLQYNGNEGNLINPPQSFKRIPLKDSSISWFVQIIYRATVDSFHGDHFSSDKNTERLEDYLELPADCFWKDCGWHFLIWWPFPNDLSTTNKMTFTSIELGLQQESQTRIAQRNASSCSCKLRFGTHLQHFADAECCRCVPNNCSILQSHNINLSIY